jgi:HAL2 family 3'(2'),5'-bisphosphate nucleotidase
MTVDDATIAAALEAVRLAAGLTSSSQGRLAAGDTSTKSDLSPVTVADFGAQAVVCSTLASQLGEVVVVGEEDAADLANDADGLLDGVVSLVSASLGRPVTGAEVVDWISIGSGRAASSGRYWTLDPIDGTKGFLRGDQYAIALGLIEDGEVLLGVLGCPNLANASGSPGAVFVAANGSTLMYAGDERTGRPLRVVDPPSLADARFCESVESGHSDHAQSSEIAARLGISTEPYRIDSQCKYAAIARSDATIYLRLPTRADYVEKIWDHAAGKFVVEQAGGRVTDVNGAELDFGQGAGLDANSGVVATSGGFHDRVVEAVRAVLG